MLRFPPRLLVLLLTKCFLCSYLVASVDRSDVCTKYQEASKIVNLALQGLVSQCLPGAKVIDLCEFGHTVITTQASKLYTKKVNGRTIDRGVAFPVCISVNDIVCNHSPLPTEERVSSLFSFNRLSNAYHGRPKCTTIVCRCPLLLRRGRFFLSGKACIDWDTDLIIFDRKIKSAL